MERFTHKNIPTIFVVFGATGDLMTRKTVPSLFRLWKLKKLPTHFRVLGFSHRKLDDKTFRKHVEKILLSKKIVKKRSEAAGFLKLFHFEHGSFTEEKDFIDLKAHLKKIEGKWGVCTNKIFYLAVTPTFIGPIVENLKEVGLSKPCGGKLGWSRLIVEKPIGQDGMSAKKLEKTLGSAFKQSQIYRIDHYLGKEMIEGLMNFRFSNNLFEHVWNAKHVEKIEIRTLETIDVKKRGAFYETVGALRDVGQNHLLQMLALLMMNHPGTVNSGLVRRARARLLRSLVPPRGHGVKKNTVRAQYVGYRHEKGVARRSATETYFKLKTKSKLPRWKGIPIYIEAGKALKDERKDIVITFKHPKNCLCPMDRDLVNRVVLTLAPTEGITIEFLTKKPGFTSEVEKREFEFYLYEREVPEQYTIEYARLFYFAIQGDQTWFVSKDEVAAQWAFTDPIERAWRHHYAPLRHYKRHTNQILKKADHILGN